MIKAVNMVRWGLVACLCASLSPMRAQDTGFSKEFKFRLGYAQNPKDHMRAPYTGFGLNLGYGIGVGRLGLELGYFYKTGDTYITRPDDSALGAAQLPMNPAKSVEDKRNQLAGFSVRTAFSRELAENWRWQAGLQFGGTFKHQYVGDTQSLPWDAGTGTAGWRDFYLGTPTKGGLNPTPFGGVSWKADKDSSVELNLVLLNYQAIEYHHFAGTGTVYVSSASGPHSSVDTAFPSDSLAKKNRLVPHLEIAYVFHF
ncbi:MAG: hypothetical protein HY014_09335 [Acidobacteria bacterium]|nr:hypothetical protein [Acidobacteriota bacterium]MBI3488357.1 hypothetical protein [Acidobacteriota bacterium]